jgi:hypothetical protein
MLFDDIKHKLRCCKCGGKEFGMTRTPPTMNKGTGWHCCRGRAGS